MKKSSNQICEPPFSSSQCNLSIFIPLDKRTTEKLTSNKMIILSIIYSIYFYGLLPPLHLHMTHQKGERSQWLSERLMVDGLWFSETDHRLLGFSPTPVWKTPVSVSSVGHVNEGGEKPERVEVTLTPITTLFNRGEQKSRPRGVCVCVCVMQEKMRSEEARTGRKCLSL